VDIHANYTCPITNDSYQCCLYRCQATTEFTSDHSAGSGHDADLHKEVLGLAFHMFLRQTAEVLDMHVKYTCGIHMFITNKYYATIEMSIDDGIPKSSSYGHRAHRH